MPRLNGNCLKLHRVQLKFLCDDTNSPEISNLIEIEGAFAIWYLSITLSALCSFDNQTLQNNCDAEKKDHNFITNKQIKTRAVSCLMMNTTHYTTILAAKACMRDPYRSKLLCDDTKKSRNLKFDRNWGRFRHMISEYHFKCTLLIW